MEVYIYIYSRTTTSEDLRCCCSLYGIIIFLSRFVVGKSESSGASCQGRKKGREEEREAVCCETNEFSKIVLRKRGGGEPNGELIKLISMSCHSNRGFLERVKREEVDENRGRENWPTIFVGPLVNRSSKAKAG